MAVVKHLSMIGLLCQAGSCDKTPSYQGSENLEDNIIQDSISSLGGSVPGLPGEDYPILSSPPVTSFSCDDKVNGGYYADVEARCQAFHICAGEEELQIFSFLCPNGTLFNQQYFVCDWWFNVDCDNTQQFYSLNDELDVARQEADQSNYGSDILKEPTNGGFGTSISSYSRSDNGVRGSGLRRSLSQLVQEAEKDSFKFPKDDVLSNEIDDSPVHKQPAISLQSLYGPPGGSNRQGSHNKLEEILSFEAEIPPAYKRPSRDLQFDYVNTAKMEATKAEVAKAAREAEEEAHQLLETLVRLVSPEDLEDLYIR